MSCDVGLANTKLLIQQWFHLILPSDTVVIRVGVETLWYSHYDCFLMTHFWEHNPVWWHMALTGHIFYKCVSLICVYVHIFKLSQFLEVRDSRRSLLDGWFCFRISQDTVDDVSAETVPISVVDWPWSSFNMVPKQGFGCWQEVFVFYYVRPSQGLLICACFLTNKNIQEHKMEATPSNIKTTSFFNPILAK